MTSIRPTPGRSFGSDLRVVRALYISTESKIYIYIYKKLDIFGLMEGESIKYSVVSTRLVYSKHILSEARHI
jgi:hypothetical protein